MKVIVGLGNPGDQYACTRHNVGFMAIDYITQVKKLSFRGKFQSELSETVLDNEKVFLVKPQTFMNLSGRALREIINWYKLDPKDLVIIYDDMDIPFGKIKLREQGGPAGHNGIKSIIYELGTQNFARIRVGIGRPPEKWDPVNYVLGNFLENEVSELPKILEKVNLAVTDVLTKGFLQAMNVHNR